MALASISKCAAFRGVTGHLFLRLLRSELKRWLTFAVLTIWAAGGWSGAAAEEKLQVLQHHVRPAVAQGKAQMKRAMAPDAQLNISIVLPLRDEAGLDRLLARLYDPSSPDYRQFLSVAEFTQRFGPTQEDYAAVVAFAQSNGLEVTENPENRLVVPLRGTVAAINKALHVQMADDGRLLRIEIGRHEVRKIRRAVAAALRMGEADETTAAHRFHRGLAEERAGGFGCEGQKQNGTHTAQGAEIGGEFLAVDAVGTRHLEDGVHGVGVDFR